MILDEPSSVLEDDLGTITILANLKWVAPLGWTPTIHIMWELLVDYEWMGH